MGKIFCGEFQRYPLKFHTKYFTHILKDTIFMQCWKFKSSQIYELAMPPGLTVWLSFQYMEDTPGLVHTLFYFLHNIMDPYMMIKRRSLHTNVICHWLCLHSADDFTIYCWWRHNAITQPDNLNVSTWKVISNLLDIDFIHSDIPGWSCKKSWK